MIAWPGVCAPLSGVANDATGDALRAVRDRALALVEADAQLRPWARAAAQDDSTYRLYDTPRSARSRIRIH
ncbi:hypothetical protein OAN61_00580 [bacterium]|nr:hypothetical protein [bacterium]